MGMTIPVLFMPIDANSVGPLNSWDDVWRHIEPFADGSKLLPPLRMASSRNWWHLEWTSDLADKKSLPGLAFLRSPYCLLTTAEIAAAIRSIVTLLEQFSTPDENCDSLRDVDQFFMDQETTQPKDAADKRLQSAYREAVVKQDVSVTSDAGYYALVDFYSFLKSLVTSLTEALLDGRAFLWAQHPA